MNNNLQADINLILNQTNDLDTTLNLQKERQIRLEEILKIYKLRFDYDPKLPITQRRDEIISLIEKKEAQTQFTIIQGGTDCGKTTQIPQYILDHYMKQKKYCNIIATQPRRIAAISVSRRVCHERG